MTGLTFVPALDEVLDHGCNSQDAGYGAKDDGVQDLSLHSILLLNTVIVEGWK